MPPTWLRATGGIAGAALAVFGLVSIPEDAERWASFLGTVNNDAARYLLVIAGLALIAAALLWRRSPRRDVRLTLTTGNDRPFEDDRYATVMTSIPEQYRRVERHDQGVTMFVHAGPYGWAKKIRVTNEGDVPISNCRVSVVDAEPPLDDYTQLPWHPELDMGGRDLLPGEHGFVVLHDGWFPNYPWVKAWRVTLRAVADDPRCRVDTPFRFRLSFSSFPQVLDDQES